MLGKIEDFYACCRLLFLGCLKKKEGGGRPGELCRCTVILVVVETMKLTTIQFVYEGCFEQLMNG